jgi:hypothetical protein
VPARRHGGLSRKQCYRSRGRSVGRRARCAIEKERRHRPARAAWLTVGVRELSQKKK